MVQIHQDVDIAIVNDFIAYITSKIKVYFSFSSILESKVFVFLMFFLSWELLMRNIHHTTPNLNHISKSIFSFSNYVWKNSSDIENVEYLSDIKNHHRNNVNIFSPFHLNQTSYMSI